MAGDQPDWTGQGASFVQEQSVTFYQENTATIAAQAGEQVTFLAPAGSFVTIGGFSCQANPPSGATTGTHDMDMILNFTGGYTAYILGASSKLTDDVHYDYGYWYSATSSSLPPSTQPQAWYAGKVGIDAVDGVSVLYTNGTNVSQTHPRVYSMYGIKKVYQA